MYVDRDSSGRIAVMDLKPEEFETIRRAIKAFTTGLLRQYASAENIRTDIVSADLFID